jgi:hypothetical protein
MMEGIGDQCMLYGDQARTSNFCTNDVRRLKHFAAEVFPHRGIYTFGLKERYHLTVQFLVVASGKQVSITTRV